MAEVTAIGEGPIVYSTGSGKQISLPLSAIVFDGNVAKPSRAVSDDPGALTAWLKYLVKQGRILPGPTPAPVNAMVFTAAAAGSMGNNISVVVAESADPAKVDITVSETDIYEGLTLATLATVLGVRNAPGTKAGLLRFKPISPAVPNPPDPAPVPATAMPAVAGDPPAWKVVGPAADSVATSFMVEARGGGDSLPLTQWKIGVTNVRTSAPDPTTFTLTATWKKTVVAVGSVAELSAVPAALSFAVVVEPPGTGGYKLPRRGAVTLVGGADTALASSAKASLLASA